MLARARRLGQGGHHQEAKDFTVATERPIEGLAAREGVHAVRSEETRVHFEVDNDRLGATMEFLSSFGIVSLVSSPPTLEQLFLREYEDAP